MRENSQLTIDGAISCLLRSPLLLVGTCASTGWVGDDDVAGASSIWGVDETTKEIVVVDLTLSNHHAGRHLPELLERTPGEIDQVSADKAHDSRSCYEAILKRCAKPTIPPRRRAGLTQSPDPPASRAARDDVLRRIKAEGRYVWRTASGATRQSLTENAVSRFKGLLGVKLTARSSRISKLRPWLSGKSSTAWRAWVCQCLSACRCIDPP